MNWKAVSFLVGVLMAGSILGDTTPPAGPTNLASPSHGSAIGAWNDPQSKNDAVEVTWTPATDSESGLDGYSVLWSEKADDEPAAVKTIEEGVSSAKKEGLASGNNYYFHIRPVDNDGNWGATVRLGPFFIDKDLPASPASLATTSHANAVGQWHNPQSANATVAVSWTVPADVHSGVDGYSRTWNNVAAGIPDQTKDVEESVLTTSSTLTSGNDQYFHVRAVDNAGNWGPVAHLGPFHIDTIAPTVATVTATPTNLGSGLVRIVVLFQEDHSGMDPARALRVRVQTALRLLNASQTLWDAAAKRWEGTVTVNQTNDGTGDVTVQVDRARDNAGNTMAAFNQVAFHINAGNPGPPVASNSVMHNVGAPHSATAIPPAWSSLHSGSDYRDAQATPVVATRSGTVIRGFDAATAANPNNLAVDVQVDVGVGTERDRYNHLQAIPAAYVGNPPLDALLNPVTIQAGTQLGQIGNNGFGADTHVHWNRDITGVAVENLNPFLVLSSGDHRDPGAARPKLEDQDSDLRTVTFFNNAFADGTATGPFNTPANPIHNKIRMAAEAVDYFNFTVPAIPYGIGYWIEPRLTKGAPVRSQRAPYLLFEFSSLPFNFRGARPLFFSYNNQHRRRYAGYTWARYPFIWLTNATTSTGGLANASAAERWHTRARRGSGAKDNGTDASDARNIGEAAFGDGTYLPHVIVYDVTMERVDLVDRDTAAEAVEILVDNFAPFVVQLEARQGDLKVYEAAWTQTGAAGTLAPAAQDARNPKWVNKKGDIRFVASLSEPIRTDANRPRLLIKDKDDNIQTVAMDPVPDSKQMKWTCAIAEADLQDHRYDDEPRQLAFVGQDLARNELDANPSTAAVKNPDGTWTGYDNAPDANWNNLVVDLQHKIKIDTKHDQKAEINPH